MVRVRRWSPQQKDMDWGNLGGLTGWMKGGREWQHAMRQNENDQVLDMDAAQVHNIGKDIGNEAGDEMDTEADTEEDTEECS